MTIKKIFILPLDKNLLEAIDKSLDSFDFFTLQKVNMPLFFKWWAQGKGGQMVGKIICKTLKLA